MPRIESEAYEDSEDIDDDGPTNFAESIGVSDSSKLLDRLSELTAFERFRVLLDDKDGEESLFGTVLRRVRMNILCDF